MEILSDYNVLSEGVTEQDFINNSPSLEKAQSLVECVLKGDSEAISKFRKIYWFIFSGLISGEKPEQWIDLLTKHRQHYEGLQKKQNSEILNISKTKDPTFFHPLSNHILTNLNNKNKNEELKEEIWKDITRTFPENELFQEAWTQEMLLRLLFTWSIENPDISYKQGMNELMGLFLIICHRDRFIENGTESFCSLLCSESFIEADTYSLFSRLMDLGMKPMFDSNPLDNKKPNRRAKNFFGNDFGFFYTNENFKNSVPNSPIITLCDYIFHTVLYNIDPTLYRHLKSLDLEPQIFLLRWIRLLFSREFNFFNTIYIWDAIFADYFHRHDSEEFMKDTKRPNLDFCKNFELVIYFAISMLKFVKLSLIDSDQSGCLKRLLRFPPIESISLLVKTAIESRREFQRFFKTPHPLSENCHDCISSTSENLKTFGYNRKFTPYLPANTNFTKSNTHGLSSKCPENGLKILQGHINQPIKTNQVKSVSTNKPSSQPLPISKLAQHTSQIKNFVTAVLELQNGVMIKDELELIQHDLSMLAEILEGELPYDPELFVISSSSNQY